MIDVAGERLTLYEAYEQYRVPVATLRYWLDRQMLTRQYDEQRRVTIDRDELEQVLAERKRRRGEL